MKNITLGFAQRIQEYNFMKSSLKKYDDVIMIPLNLETLIYYKSKNIKHYNLLNLLDNKFHVNSLNEFEKVNSNIKKFFNKKENFLKIRYTGIIRKYCYSVYFIISIINNLKKKYNIQKIIVSGWDKYSFDEIKNNFFVSKIISKVYKKELKICYCSKKNFQFQYNKKSLVIPSSINYDYIFIDNLGYNFKKLIFANFFRLKNRKYFLTFDDGKIGLLKKYIYKLLLVRFIKLESKFSMNRKRNFSYIKLPKIKAKFENYDISQLIKDRGKHIKYELDGILNQKKKLIRLFGIKKPKKFFLNSARGINNFIVEYASKNKIICYLVPHGTLSNQKKIYGKIYNDTIAEEVTSSKAINCAQTPLAFDYMKSNFNKKNILKTHNLIFSQGKSLKNKFFLYAVTSRDLVNNQLFGIETFYEFYDNLIFLNDYSKKKKIKIIVKLHPGVSYLASEISILFDNLIFSNSNLEKLLNESISLISFSSSVIEDALNYKVPVILLDRWKRYNHFDKIKKDFKDAPVKYTTNLNEFNDKINQFLNFKKKKFNKFIYNGNSNKNFRKLL